MLETFTDLLVCERTCFSPADAGIAKQLSGLVFTGPGNV